MNGLQPAHPKRRETLVSVCAKCAGDGSALRRALRAECEKRGARKTIRVVKTSCLDVCPKRGVAVALADRRAGRPLRFFVVSKLAGIGALVALALE